MKRVVSTAILFSVLASLSAAAADPRVFEGSAYARIHIPSSPVEQAPGPYLAQGYGDRAKAARKREGGGRQVIPPSVALRTALGYSPGSQGLGVRLLKDGRLMYAVKLKTGNRVHRVLVDAQTGQVVGD